jgi:hypothetical protein
VFPKLQPADKRGEVVKFEEGFTVINDSYNSSPTALNALAELLAATPGISRILAAGEMRELGDVLARTAPRVRAAVAGCARSTGSSVYKATPKNSCAQQSQPAIRPSARDSSRIQRKRAVSRRIHPAGDLLLLKGSRGVKMEKILEAIDAGHARSGAQAPAKTNAKTERAAAQPKGRELRCSTIYFLLLRPHFSPLNVFRYITVRTAMASPRAAAVAAAGAVGDRAAARFAGEAVHPRRRPEGASEESGYADDGRRADRRIDHNSHAAVGRSAQPYVLLAMGATLAFGTIGFVDDYNKVVRKQKSGPHAAREISLQVLTCVGVGGSALVSLQTQGAYSTQLSVPFFKRLHPDLVISSLLRHSFIWPLAYVPFVLFLVLVIVGCSNAVNLTDGLDGLAIGCVLVASTALTVLTYLSSNARSPTTSRCRKFPMRRAGNFLRVAGRRVAGISLVQRASRGNVHGRRGIARAGRCDRHRGGDHQAGNFAALDRRRFRASSVIGDHSGGLVQADRQARLSHGAAASSFRAAGLERIEDHRAVLDSWRWCSRFFR